MESSTEQHGNVEVGIVIFEGREFVALGSVIQDGRIVAYLGKDKQLTKWDGTVIGTYRLASSWLTPSSCYSSRMFQVYATVNGITYTGRSAGEGIVFKGKQVGAV